MGVWSASLGTINPVKSWGWDCSWLDVVAPGPMSGSRQLL
jgi:hypothetical protein